MGMAIVFHGIKKLFPEFWDLNEFLKEQGFSVKMVNGKFKKTPELPYAVIYEKEGKEYWITKIDLSSNEPKIYMDSV